MMNMHVCEIIHFCLPLDLEESVIDMIAVHWERTLGGHESVPNQELGTMDEKYLKRYTEHDKEKVRSYLEKVRQF